MSYGADRMESFQRVAALVDRILKGANPADLPFEQPTRYLFLINLGVARAMGLEIPPSLLALADNVTSVVRSWPLADSTTVLIHFRFRPLFARVRPCGGLCSSTR